MRQARFATVFRGTNRAKSAELGARRRGVRRWRSRLSPAPDFIFAAINSPSTGLVEYWAIRWVTDALPLGRAPRATVRRRIKGADMLAWLLWRLERMERIRAVASALMREFGDEAYAQARRREREADGDERARDWSRVALVVARRTCAQGSVGKSTEIVSGRAADVPDSVCLRNARSGANEFDGEAD